MPRRTAPQRTVPASRLRWTCPPAWLPFATTDEISSSEEISGQERALLALRLGLRIRARGYNVYVSGAPGTGRTSIVRRLLQNEGALGPTATDLLYVQNFQSPRRPLLLRLPAGKGGLLQQAMQHMADRFRQGQASLRASISHREKRDRMTAGVRDEQSEILRSLQQELEQHGFALVEVPIGNYRRHELAIMLEGNPTPIEELPNLVAEGRLTTERAEALKARYPQLQAQLSAVGSKLRELARELERKTAEIDRAAADPLVDAWMEELRVELEMKAGEAPQLDQHLEQVREFLLRLFVEQSAIGEAVPADGTPDLAPDPLGMLAVNLIVDRSGSRGRPVIEENHPSPPRLLGFVEPPRQGESLARPDLSRIRPGSLLQADGGFLLINAQDLLSQEEAWPALRRALRSRSSEFCLGEGGDGLPPLAPELAEVDVTVVMIGTHAVREQFVENDEEFHRLFKVTALFEERVPLTQEIVQSFARFLKMVLDDERLPPFEAAAVARLIEFMVRTAESQTRLSTRLRMLADLAREASWFSREAGTLITTRRDVESALTARRERQGALSQHVLQSIHDGTLLLELEGARVGQVNALAVVETSLERFGYPMRVTATTAIGRAGIIDIEREAELSGEIHTKASLILAGYLRSRFAQRHPLAITASVCFEQSYGGVEGDSASSAELAALISSLAAAPVRQDLAVTGAVDQGGQILPVGGVNEKVEGFWQVCRRRGLTGKQGVILPSASIDSLQLGQDLVADVQAGRFHVYAVETVEQLIELLSGTALGKPTRQGVWPTGSLGGRISRRLKEMAVLLQRYGGIHQ